MYIPHSLGMVFGGVPSFRCRVSATRASDSVYLTDENASGESFGAALANHSIADSHREIQTTRKSAVRPQGTGWSRARE